MGACASYPVVAESPHEPPAEAAVGLSEVLRQLPADVVCAEIWPHLDNLPAFKLSGRAARNLVHSTQRRVVLRPERWGGGSAAELKLVAAALARYVAVDTLVLDAAPLGVLGAARGLLVGLEAGRHWRVHELLRLASPFLGLRVRHWRSERMYGVADFPALPGSCLPGLCTLEGVRLAGCGSAAPLAALPHLTACSVAFYKTTTDLQKEIYAVGQLAQGLMRLRLAGVTKYPRSCLPDYIRICGYYFYLPGVFNIPAPVQLQLAPLSALTNLQELQVGVRFEPDLLQFQVSLQKVAWSLDGLPASLTQLCVSNVAVTRAACRALAALPRLQRLELDCAFSQATRWRINPASFAEEARLPPTVKELRLLSVSQCCLPALVPTLQLITGASVSMSVVLDDAGLGLYDYDTGPPDGLQQLSALRGLAHVRCLELTFDAPEFQHLQLLLDVHVLPQLSLPLWRLTLMGQVEPELRRGGDGGGGFEGCLCEQLEQCTGLEVLQLDALSYDGRCGRRVRGTLRMGLVGRLLFARLPLLRRVVLDASLCPLYPLYPPWSSAAAEWLAACLAARAGRGLAPLALDTAMLTASEASRLQAELLARGAGGYTVTSIS